MNVPVMWSWMAPMTGPPNLGDRMCSCTFIRMMASALSLLGLQHVQVHLVAIEIGVVGRADAQVQPEGLPWHDAHGVGHHGHAVQRRLPVEQHDVAVHAGAFRR